MGFKKIGHKFKKLKKLGSKIGHGISIGARKIGKTVKKVAEKATPLIQTLGAVTGQPELLALADVAQQASQAGDLISDVGRFGGSTLNAKGSLADKVTSSLEKKQELQKRADDLFK